jgi:hypothetical protein
MLLRNGKMYNEFPVIDFDFATNAWRKNKRALGNGMFAYKKIKKYKK